MSDRKLLAKLLASLWVLFFASCSTFGAITASNELSQSPVQLHANGYAVELPKINVNFSTHGIQASSKVGSLDWSWQLSESSPAALGTLVAPTYDGKNFVEYNRGTFVERYVVKTNTVEQQFLIPTAPAADIEIRGTVTSNGNFSRRQQGWVWEHGSGKLIFGDLLVLDANGKQINARMDVTKDETTIFIAALDLKNAAFPILIDPEIGSNDFRISTAGANGNTAISAIQPAVAYNSQANEFFAVWASDEIFDEAFEIFGQRINASTGALIGAAVRLSDMGAVDNSANFYADRPSVAYNSQDNEYLVAWRGEDDTAPLVDGEMEIFIQRVTAAGVEIGTNDVRISDLGPDGNVNYLAVDARIAYNSIANEYLVVWRGDDNTAPLVDNEFEIFGQRISNVGAELGSNDFRISDMGPDGDGAFDTGAPFISYNPVTNEYIVTWQGDDTTDGEFGCWAQFLNAAGAEVGVNDLQISTVGNIGTNQVACGNPPIPVYNSVRNEYFVTFAQNVTALTKKELYGQRISAARALIGSNKQISILGPLGDTNFNTSENVAVSYDSVHDEYLVITSADTDEGALVDNEFEVYAIRVDASDGLPFSFQASRITDFGPDGDANYGSDRLALAFNTSQRKFLTLTSADDNIAPLVQDELEIIGQFFAAPYADLSVSKTDVADPVNAGTNVSYTLTVQNDGPINASTITLTDVVPNNTTFVSASGAGWVCSQSNSVITCTRAALTTGSAAVVNVVVLANEAFTGNLTSTATVAATGTNDEITANDSESETTTISSDADLSIAVSDSLDPAISGESLSYTLAVTNAGPSTALTLTLTQTLPSDVTFVSASGTGWSCGHAAGVVTCTRASLAAGAAPDVTVTGTITAGITSNLMTTPSISAVTADATPANNSELETTSTTPDTDSDGIPDVTDTDDDGDGLSDVDEGAQGTNSLVTDSDNDSVSDGQEDSDGSNPLDSGSVLPRLSTASCSEWSGFLDGVYNIAEYNNLTSDNIQVRSTLRNGLGVEQSSLSFGVVAGAQTDVLVHDIVGFQVNAVGQLCSENLSGGTGALDGRMVFYKPRGSEFDFAFSVPFGDGLKESQFVLFDAQQPSTNPADSGNFVANWIQVTNQESTEQTGAIIFYAQDGSVLGQDTSVSLSGFERRDFAAHQFNPQLLGLVEWRPVNSTAQFQMRGIRYFYDNPGPTSNTFDSAVQLDAFSGNGELIAAALDTRNGSSVVEIANTLSTAQNVDVRIYDSAGNQLLAETRNLPGFGSAQISASDVLSNAIGLVTVDAAAINGAVANVLHYGLDTDGSLQFVYTLPLKQALGSVLRGTYNTFLDQGCSLLIANPTAADTTATISMVRRDGTQVLSGEMVSIAARGAVEFDPCSRDIDDDYGVLTVQPALANTIVAENVRLGQGDTYRFSTPVRQ